MVAAIAPDLKPLSVKFTEGQIEWLDQWASNLHVPRSQVIRFVIDAARRSGLEFSPAESNLGFERKVENIAASLAA